MLIIHISLTDGTAGVLSGKEVKVQKQELRDMDHSASGKGVESLYYNKDGKKRWAVVYVSGEEVILYSVFLLGKQVPQGACTLLAYYIVVSSLQQIINNNIVAMNTDKHL